MLRFLKWSFVLIFILASFYDFLTSFMGTALLLNAQGYLVWGLAFVVSMACLSINFATADVWKQGGALLRGIWAILFSYDLVTTAVGVGHVVQTGTFFGYRDVGDALNGFSNNLGVALPVTFIIVISPVLAVWIIRNME